MISKIILYHQYNMFMKLINITKSVLLLILFIAVGCTGNQKKSQASNSENETNAEFPNAQYAGEYEFLISKPGDPFGIVYIYCQEGDTISFYLNVCMGAPTYNTGELSGALEIADDKGVFKSSEFGDCILEFVFADNSVKISQQEGGYECGFGKGVSVNNTFVRKRDEISSFPAGKISEEMLWEIFMKIPEDDIPEYWPWPIKTDRQRRLTKINKHLKIQHEKYDNHLRYDETNRDGVRNFMGLSGYPTDDEKKIIVLFYIGGGVDIFSTPFKQTYEYDIATGELNAIECPIDPYTEDEFFDESFLTSKHLQQLRASFSSPNKDEYINYVGIDRDGFNVYFATYDAFDDWDEYVEHADVVRTFYDYDNDCVRREWNGKRFVKTERKTPDFLIIDKSAGRFKIGEQISNPYQSDDNVDYKMERTERTETREGTEEKIIEYAFSRYSDTMLIIKPMYDYTTDAYTDKTGEIIILSEKYKTKDMIGINSTIDDFIKIYPDYRLWWTYVSDMYVLESETAGENIQFLLDADDCIITPNTDSDITILSRDDFKKDTQIKKIRIR